MAIVASSRRTAALLLAALSLPAAAVTCHAQTSATGRYLGFDRNTFPGEAALPALRQHFSFVGYWLNTPPGAHSNSWAGHRAILVQAGFGFLVLWNGRLDAQIKHAGVSPEILGRADAAHAITAAQREHFPPGTLLFLDQEEGGRLLPEQAAYLLAWTEAVAAISFRPGVYTSGQPVTDGPGPGETITTAADISTRVRTQHLHPVALWVAQDSCGPSTGCTLIPPPFSANGTPDALVWQYAQSPRRPEITRTCARTYNAHGNCTVPELPALFLDLNLSPSADPSRGR